MAVFALDRRRRWPKRCAIRDDRGILSEGVNFASQDYLSMSSHPGVHCRRRREAIDTIGVHSAGSPALVGNTSTSVELEKRLASFVGMKEAILFPTGWAAGFGVIKGLVRVHDYIVMDALAHACLQIGAAASTTATSTCSATWTPSIAARSSPRSAQQGSRSRAS